MCAIRWFRMEKFMSPESVEPLSKPLSPRCADTHIGVSDAMAAPMNDHFRLSQVLSLFLFRCPIFTYHFFASLVGDSSLIVTASMLCEKKTEYDRSTDGWMNVISIWPSCIRWDRRNESDKWRFIWCFFSLSRSSCVDGLSVAYLVGCADALKYVQCS